MASSRQAVWLDCDPGHDDVFAILLAGHHPSIQLLGLSVSAGNQTLAHVTHNAVDVVHAGGLDHIGVYAGQAKPLLRSHPMLCPEIHGETGLDGPDGGRVLPRSPQPISTGKAVVAMFDAISKAYMAGGRQRRVRLVCTGPLTNAALLLILYPEAHEMVDIVLMGGSMGTGNTGPVAEFNIQTDPEAAKLVFESGVPLTMVPLEVTHTVLATPEVLTRIGAGAHGSDQPTPFLRAMQQLLLFFASTYKDVFQFDDPPLHDPCAVAYVVAPHLFKTRTLRVDVETISLLSPGQTVCDVWSQTGRPPNCTVCTSIDVPRFWALMLDALFAADAVSPLNRPQPGTDAANLATKFTALFASGASGEAPQADPPAITAGDAFAAADAHHSLMTNVMSGPPSPMPPGGLAGRQPNE